MNNDLMFSSKNQAWATRWDFFNQMMSRFNFTLDVCAGNDDQKCDKYFTPEDDGLIQSWEGETFWCNPPYGREYPEWVKKGLNPIYNGVILIPARTDTVLFHDYIVPAQTDGTCAIEFLRGRLTFGSDKYWEWLWGQEYLENGKKNSLYQKYGKMNPAPFPSMLIKIGNCKDK